MYEMYAPDSLFDTKKKTRHPRASSPERLWIAMHSIYTNNVFRVACKCMMI